MRMGRRGGESSSRRKKERERISGTTYKRKDMHMLICACVCMFARKFVFLLNGLYRQASALLSICSGMWKLFVCVKFEVARGRRLNERQQK